MSKEITEEQLLGAAKELDQEEFTRADIAKHLDVDRSDFKAAFKAARQEGRLEKLGNDGRGSGRFRLTAG